MKKQFITFSEGVEYNELCSVLKDSINEFSRHDLTIYTAKDFNIPWQPKEWQRGYIFIFKILSCLKALEEYDEIVWLDTDIVVTSKIDKIWNYTNQDFPLLPRYRFYNFINWPHSKKGLFNLKLVGELLGKYDNYDYVQACCMKFDKKSKAFFEESLSYFDNFQSKKFPMGDETIINYLLRQKNINQNLGDIFLCSHHFDYYHIYKFFDLKEGDLQSYQDLFNPLLTPQEEKNRKMFNSKGEELKTIYWKLNRLGLVNCSNEILFLHGSKNVKKHRDYLEHQAKNKSNLSTIMEKNGSDKSTSHNYTELYESIFSKFRNEKINIFEMGLGTNNTNLGSNMGISGKPGASLRGWTEYFKKSNVYGADIDRDILFEEENISTFWCDQTNQQSIKDMWHGNKLKDLLFDIIIDDGLHEFEANLIFLENSIHKLKPGGYYIVEDLMPETVKLFRENLNYLQNKWPSILFEVIEVQGRPGRIDNNLLVAKKIKT